ncbi:collagen alpha-4(IV) chain-like [Mustela erminea]|uniref:collagen alpha-4(IV) chain-like n=1 Tax=Mustela erminea TaxID=36723 RepID=UPI001387153E|nr:collagen alpha-4(IV) chain-like [Mustela erminea]XP_032214256.1 collagen alpha-4(IV) chain-like [Mustela erminea]XP_032214257.1 collagen alpha-4(IV) chain-like [Mustela erminea]XP_032214258.1 collagen alpha-4(IV) chain-like [Mustela erminea]XP_032214259.1 collagen alpha-4(IV) chain-like [Mustela erminea]XP_032214260.1 collagen alpha-4(IV) chain-like [Mustela erminea]XP_032214261.1 collagen alpha-4(IV) chain-like [Mustela erminea]
MTSLVTRGRPERGALARGSLPPPPPPGLTVVLALPPCRPARGPRFGHDSHLALGGPDPARSPLCSAAFWGLWVTSGNRASSRLPRGSRGGGGHTGFQRASDPCPCAPPRHGCATWVPVSARPQLTTRPQDTSCGLHRPPPVASLLHLQWLLCRLSRHQPHACVSPAVRTLPAPARAPAGSGAPGTSQGTLCTSRSECQDKCRVPGPMGPARWPGPPPPALPSPGTGQRLPELALFPLCAWLPCLPWPVGSALHLPQAPGPPGLLHLNSCFRSLWFRGQSPPVLKGRWQICGRTLAVPLRCRALAVPFHRRYSRTPTAQPCCSPLPHQYPTPAGFQGPPFLSCFWVQVSEGQAQARPKS